MTNQEIDDRRHAWVTYRNNKNNRNNRFGGQAKWDLNGIVISGPVVTRNGYFLGADPEGVQEVRTPPPRLPTMIDIMLVFGPSASHAAFVG